MSASETLEELCRRLKASDRGAFEQVFRQLREGLLRYVRSIVENDTVAHDLVQDVFVYLWGLRETLDPSRPLKAYLYRMARNRAYRFLRDERAHAEKHEILRGSCLRLLKFVGVLRTEAVGAVAPQDRLYRP